MPWRIHFPAGREGYYVKIGFTELGDGSRMKALQTGLVGKVKPYAIGRSKNAYGIEQLLHEMFAVFNTYATHGGGTEWFALPKAALALAIAYVNAL